MCPLNLYIKKDSQAFLNELVACHCNSHNNEIKKQTFEVLHVHLRFVIRRSAVRYNIFHMGGEGQDFRTLNRVYFLCLNFKLERPG